MLPTFGRGRRWLHEGCQNPATGQTARIVAKRAPLGAPSPSATPATRQLLEEGRELTHPHLALALAPALALALVLTLALALASAPVRVPVPVGAQRTPVGHPRLWPDPHGGGASGTGMRAATE